MPDERVQAGRKLLHVSPLQDVKPNFPGEDAGGEQVVVRLIALPTQCAVRAGL